MKPAVAIVLILCGAMLICVPPLSDFLWGLNVTKVSDATHTAVIGLPGHMGNEYRFGCFACGIVMIGIAVFACLGRREPA